MRHFEPYSPFATDGLGALDYHFDTRSQPDGCTMIGRTLSVLIGKRFHSRVRTVTISSSGIPARASSSIFAP